MATAAPPPMAAVGGPPPPDASASAVSVSVLSGLGGGGEGDGGEGDGGNGCEGAGVGEKSGGPGDSVMLGFDCTLILSAAEAAAAVPRVEESEVCTAAGVVEAGTTIVAVMITLAAATRMDTEAASTPALAAIKFRRAEVSE
jgi:hypothetical protein